MSAPPPPSYLILGSGVFGASTALHLIRRHGPSASITLLDRDAYTATTRVAASWDWNKVIRADYDDLTYTRLALEAQRLWRSEPIWRPYYHQSGVVWITRGRSFAKHVRENYAALGVEDEDLKVYEVAEAKGLYGGLFGDADYSGVGEVLVNKGSGWAEAKEALRATIEEAVRLGVGYVVAEVERVKFEEVDGRSRATGVVTADGREILADRVVLCTGAYTAKLLVDSAPDWTGLHAGERIVACGVTEATGPVSEPEKPGLDTMPVGVSDNPVERGEDVGCLPLPGPGAVKCWGQIHLKNTVPHPITKQPMSIPPIHRDYAQWEVSPGLQDDVHWALRSLFGDEKARLKKMENYRICWDAWTPTGDFIISPHSGCDGLFVATCGSFHGFKFLPVIGKYVVQMLSGELDPALQERWAWDRERPSINIDDKGAGQELKDFPLQEVPPTSATG